MNGAAASGLSSGGVGGSGLGSGAGSGGSVVFPPNPNGLSFVDEITAAASARGGRKALTPVKFWTPSEDDIVRAGMTEFLKHNPEVAAPSNGTGQLDQIPVAVWRLVATRLPGRSPKQVRDRWRNYLDPHLVDPVEQPWTPEEDLKIEQLRQQHGNSWKVIASHLPGRSENVVKNRFYSSMRKYERLLKKQAEQTQVLTFINTGGVPGSDPSTLNQMRKRRRITVANAVAATLGTGGQPMGSTPPPWSDPNGANLFADATQMQGGQEGGSAQEQAQQQQQQQSMGQQGTQQSGRRGGREEGEGSDGDTTAAATEQQTQQQQAGSSSSAAAAAPAGPPARIAPLKARLRTLAVETVGAMLAEGAGEEELNRLRADPLRPLPLLMPNLPDASELTAIYRSNLVNASLFAVQFEDAKAAGNEEQKRILSENWHASSSQLSSATVALAQLQLSTCIQEAIERAAAALGNTGPAGAAGSTSAPAAATAAQ
jgi:hypothetical protein